jgi:anti-anti-sigma regulatory factor
MHRSAALVAQVLALETPVTTLDTAVLYAPLVGHLSSERANNLRARLLSTVHERRARWVIVDIQGVPDVDTRIAGELHATFQALTLLGCQVCLCGITAAVAAALTQLELGFEGVQIVRSPQEALLHIQRERYLTEAESHSVERPHGLLAARSLLTAAARGGTTR